MDTLRRAVLRDPTAAETAFGILEHYCGELAKNHDGANRLQLQEYLQRQPQSIHVLEPLSFRNDINRCRGDFETDG